MSVPLTIPGPRPTPRVEVVVGQELEGVGLERLRLDVAALRVLLQVHTRALHGGGLLSLPSVPQRTPAASRWPVCRTSSPSSTPPPSPRSRPRLAPGSPASPPP